MLDEAIATEPSAPPTYSPDGEWWWSGSDWKPALSPDRQLRFDGESWVRLARRSPFPLWSIAPTFIWFTLLGVWLPLSVVTFRADDPGRDTLIWAIVGGSIVASATLALGIAFGATRRALWLWLAVPVGTFAQTVGYLVFVESTAASNATGGDISMGFGAVVLSIPIFLALLTLIWVGAALGRLAAKLRRRVNSGWIT